MPANGEIQTTLSFVGEHQGITIAFIGLLFLVIGYLFTESNLLKKENKKGKSDSTTSIINGLHSALTLQRETIDNTLSRLDATIGKLEKAITDLAAELFRDMHSLDRRLSKLEGEHDVIHKLRRGVDNAKDGKTCEE